jgi:integrase
MSLKGVRYRPSKKRRKLPRILNADDFRRFYEVVDHTADVQHALMLRLSVLITKCGLDTV